MDILDLTFNHLTQALAIIIVLWFVVKNFREMKEASDKDMKRKEGWDKAAKVIEEKEKLWDEGLEDVYNERKQIVEKFDKRLDEVDKKIDDNYTDTEAKIQEIKAELLILTECMRAVLDGLYQQGCNGKVTEARHKLDEHLVTLIGK
jgi:predicted nuclease with TOPRIM domain